MGLIAKAFDGVMSALGRKRIIYDRESNLPYMNRYYVFLKDRKKFPFNIFIHQFLRSDPDNLHDHPWPSRMFIIKGGYWEWIPRYNGMGAVVGEEKVWRKPFRLRKMTPYSLHRIELQPGIDCWTVFMPGPTRRDWGFLTHDGMWTVAKQKWIQHEEYIYKRMKGLL